MNYETILFAIHELWKCPFETHDYEIGKYLFAINELWKNEMFVCKTWLWTACLHYMNYENILFAYMNNENIKMFVCNNKLWKNENICCQYMNYENICYKIHELWKN